MRELAVPQLLVIVVIIVITSMRIITAIITTIIITIIVIITTMTINCLRELAVPRAGGRSSGASERPHPPSPQRDECTLYY